VSGTFSGFGVPCVSASRREMILFPLSNRSARSALLHVVSVSLRVNLSAFGRVKRGA
jgi:hypothetical protein